MTEIIRLGAASLSTAIIILGMVHIDALYERSRETNFYTERRFKKKKRLHQPASLERALWIHMLTLEEQRAKQFSGLLPSRIKQRICIKWDSNLVKYCKIIKGFAFLL